MTKINQINSLISILNVVDLKVATCSVFKNTKPRKLKMQSTLISRVKKKISPKNRCECDQEITVAEIEMAIRYFEILKTDLHKL